MSVKLNNHFLSALMINHWL